MVENLVQQIRVGKVDDGTPALKIVYDFSSAKESDQLYNQLHHEPMCVHDVVTTLHREVVLIR